MAHGFEFLVPRMVHWFAEWWILVDPASQKPELVIVGDAERGKQPLSVPDGPSVLLLVVKQEIIVDVFLAL